MPNVSNKIIYCMSCTVNQLLQRATTYTFIMWYVAFFLLLCCCLGHPLQWYFDSAIICANCLPLISTDHQEFFWLTSALEIGLEVCCIQRGSRLMRLFWISCLLSVSLGSFFLFFTSFVNSSTSHVFPFSLLTAHEFLFWLTAASILQLGSHFWCWTCD
jgi:hypothetical protein